VNGTFSLELLAEALGALLEQEGLLIADTWLTVEEAIEIAGVSRSQLYHWMRHEGLPFLDEGVRQIRLSALQQFKRDKEVVMIRGKKVPAQRANSQALEPASVRPRRKATSGSQRSVARQRSNVGRVSGAADRASLEAILNDARKAA